MESRALICPSCGNGVDKTYCGTCGEKLLTADELKLTTFLKSSAANILNTDSRLLRTLKRLLFSPGYLTTAYMEGRRVSYIRPLQLFLFANVLYFLLVTVSGINTFNTPLYWHMNATNFFHQATAETMVAAELEANSETLEAYSARFNSVIEAQSKTLVFLLIPLFALVLQLLRVFSKEPPLQQVVYSIHFFSFLLLLPFALLFVMIGLKLLAEVLALLEITIQIGDEFVVSAVSAIAIATYHVFGLRGTYKMKLLRSFIEAIILLVAFYFILMLYRALLFFTAFYTLKWFY